MASPFARTLRSLNADSYLLSLASLTLAIMLLVGWLLWFLLAQITLYETSTQFEVLDPETIRATFPLGTQTQLRPGQPALLQLNVPMGAESIAIPAIVTEVTTRNDDIIADFFVWSHYAPMPLDNSLTGNVKVEVEHISPAVLVIRATGQLMDAQAITASPQEGIRINSYQ